MFKDSKENFFIYNIFTENGFVEAYDLNGKRALDIGCGKRKLKGALGIDKQEESEADVVHDLNIFPWPLETNGFDIIIAQHILEHLNDISKVMNEIYRVSKPHSILVIQAPYFRSVEAFTDLTHKHFFTVHSLDFLPSSKFKKKLLHLGGFRDSKNPFREIFKDFIYRYQDCYERYLSVLMPVRIVTWEFEVIKDLR